MTRHRFPTERAFSLVEGLLVAVVLGIISSLVIPAVTGGPDAAKKAKLDQDVLIVNNAIDSFLAAGGSQAALTQAGVIEALKQRVYGGTAAEMVGPQGPFLDPAVVTNATDFAYSAIFLTTPRPRFVVERSTVGVVFDKGLPSPVGGVAARADSARPGWLWSYSGATAPAEAAGFNPLALDTGTRLGTTGGAISNLLAPVFVPASTNLNIWDFPLLVSILNPNTNVAETANSSLVYYRVGGGSYTLYDGTAFPADPGVSVLAIAISTDPSRFGNSPTATSTYTANKLALAVTITSLPSVTYAQAGGQMSNQAVQSPATAVISLIDSVNTVSGQPDNLVVRQTTNGTDKFIPAPYLSSAGIKIRYTMDGSDPATNAAALSPPDFSGSFTPISVSLGLAAWSNKTSTQIRAVALAANANWFTNSPTVSQTVTIATTPIALDVVPVNPVGLPVTVQINETGLVPVGLRKFYTTNSAQPLSSTNAGITNGLATLYTTPIPASALPSSSYTLVAQATGPAGYEQWFRSTPVTRSYNRVTALNPDFVGANISGGDVNGSFTGSIFVAAPANLGIFNAGGTITRGNLYLPGLPGIEITGQGNQGTTVVAQGRFYSNTPTIPRSIIAGKEYTADGELAVPQLDTRQLVDLNGTTYTNPYTVKLTTSTFIEGKIYRNVDLPTNTFTVPNLGVTNRVTGTTFDGLSSTNALLPGVYSNNIVLNNTNAVIRLGTPGVTNVTQYVFADVTFSKGRIQVDSPVQIFFTTGFVNSGVVMGSTNSLNNLKIYVTAPDGDVEIKSGGAIYGNLWVTNASSSSRRNDVTVGNGGIFFGSITAQYLTVAPGGVVNVE